MKLVYKFPLVWVFFSFSLVVVLVHSNFDGDSFQENGVPPGDAHRSRFHLIN